MARKKGFKHTEETKAKLRLRRAERKATLGYINSPETRIKIGLSGIGREVSSEQRKHKSEIAKERGYGKWMVGKKATQEHKEKMRKIALSNGFGKWMIGKEPSPETLEKLGKWKRGDKKRVWGNDANGYNQIHLWVRSLLGAPDTCEMCAKSGLTGKRIHWANKSGDYKKVLSDWMRLCVKCHANYNKNEIYVKK